MDKRFVVVVRVPEELTTEILTDIIQESVMQWSGLEVVNVRHYPYPDPTMQGGE